MDGLPSNGLAQSLGFAVVCRVRCVKLQREAQSAHVSS